MEELFTRIHLNGYPTYEAKEHTKEYNQINFLYVNTLYKYNSLKTSKHLVLLSAIHKSLYTSTS